MNIPFPNTHRQQVLQVLVGVRDGGEVHEVFVECPLVADRLAGLA